MIKTTNSPGDGNPKWHQFQRHLSFKGNQKIKCDLCYIPIRNKHPKKLFRPQLSFSDKILLSCSGEETQNMESLINRYVLCSYFQYYLVVSKVLVARFIKYIFHAILLMAPLTAFCKEGAETKEST